MNPTTPDKGEKQHGPRFVEQDFALILARLDGWTEDTSPETENSKHAYWWHDGKMIRKIESDLADAYCDPKIPLPIIEAVEWLLGLDADAQAEKILRGLNAYDADKARIAALEHMLSLLVEREIRYDQHCAIIDTGTHEAALKLVSEARKLLADAKEKA